MKLKTIKLTGFKSFVDTTVMHFQSNLTGLVGPNGCGKSNVIDAIRWVMGEISAKQLRGASMSDVIFNGCVTRKAVGQASAELIFDNSDASLGGEYAKYTEIAIRREVNRDGFSDYFLNNVNCRRKDITNIFLGTGLGHNSYAVIEQGMISRFIDAKPDELRTFIEEAAGISKYKERRRETEVRIKHTKENLARISDIINEVNQQLKTLKAQAQAAERYRKLKQEERQTKAEVHVLHWRKLQQKLAEYTKKLNEDKDKYENCITEIDVLAAKIAKTRTMHTSKNEQFNLLQGEYYRAGANISRLEQQIKHGQERHAELTKNLIEIEKIIAEISASEQEERKQLSALLAEHNQFTTEITQGTVLVDQTQKKVHAIEQHLQSIQTQCDQCSLDTAKLQQNLEVTQTHIQHLELRISEEERRKTKPSEELATLHTDTAENELAKLKQQFDVVRHEQQQLQTTIATKHEQVRLQRETCNKLMGLLNQICNTLQSLQGRKSALEVLQQAAVNENDVEMIAWLKEHKLADAPRVMKKIKVMAGWEKAIETVLGDYLQGIGVNNLKNYVSAVQALPRGNVTLVDYTIKTSVKNRAEFGTLASKINSAWSFAHLLKGVYVAEDSATAETMVQQLDVGESVITKDGLWYGIGWLKMADASNPKIGILQRAQELQELTKNIEDTQGRSTSLEQEMAAQQKNLITLEYELHELQHQAHAELAKYSNTESNLVAKQTNLHHLKTRVAALQQEINSCTQSLLELNTQLVNTKKTLEVTRTQYIASEAKRQILIQQRNTAEQDLVAMRKDDVAQQQVSNNATLRIQLLKTQSEYLEQGIKRAAERLQGVNEKKEQLVRNIKAATKPELALKQELQSACDKQAGLEGELTQAKQNIVEIEHALRTLEQQKQDQQEANEKIRLELETARTEYQGITVRSAAYNEQVAELGLSLESLNAKLPETVELNAWEEKLISLNTKINRLGLINLAAIDECTKLEERSNYLNTQYLDLINALNTLEEVMCKIDQDTRERFQGAYQNINQNFQELFPKIFNGGKASLEQTANNLLETGVVIMAQPPGKRNTSIHMLSGGEKALTAGALIFAIFHLNPAPFCVLDEVDAPLDDINVQRFCHLVQEMAKTIQFVFITHNKLTMEIAGQLVGITMQEPGVSRLVSVDIDTAVSLAKRSS